MLWLSVAYLLLFSLESQIFMMTTFHELLWMRKKDLWVNLTVFFVLIPFHLTHDPNTYPMKIYVLPCKKHKFNSDFLHVFIDMLLFILWQFLIRYFHIVYFHHIYPLSSLVSPSLGTNELLLLNNILNLKIKYQLRD